MMHDTIIDMPALSKLLDLIGGEPDDLSELIECYAEEAPALIEQLRGSVETSDIEVMRRASHTLKSSARDLGALRLGLLCEALEHRCRNGDVADVSDAVIAIEAAEVVARECLLTLQEKMAVSPAEALQDVRGAGT